MTAREALQLSIAHNLGSARNTLIPGVEVPAYTPGADPEAWHARVQAIGLSRLAPAGAATSAFTVARDPVGPMWTGGNNTQVVRRDVQGQEQAIQKLMTALRSAGGEGGTTGNFTGGRWIFGNDMGSLSSAIVHAQDADEQQRIQWASLRAQERQAAANRDIAREQIEMNRQDRTERLAQIERAWKASTSQDERARLQQAFDNELQLLEFKAGESDAASQLAAYNAQKQAMANLNTSVQDYKKAALQIASEFNSKADPNAQVRVDFVQGVAKLVPGKNTSAEALNILNARLEEQAGGKFSSAQQALADAEIAAKAAPYTRTAPLKLPTAPTFMSSLPPAPLSPAAAVAARTGAKALLVPGFTPGIRPPAVAVPASAPVVQPQITEADLMAALMPEDAMGWAEVFGGLVGDPGAPAPAPQVAPPIVPGGVAATAQPGATNYARMADVAAAAVTNSVPALATLPTVTTRKAFDALPSGARYIGKDGRTYRKP